MGSRPAFQHQGPARNCVIGEAALGWVSCTAYAMAMLIDAATDGRVRPKGCRIRRLVTPPDRTGGLTLGQVAEVAERVFGVSVALRTGPRAIPVAGATRRIGRGRGFVLQGNNVAFRRRGTANHAIYVHEVRGGTPGQPAEALVFDPQREHEAWLPWARVLGFGAALRLADSPPRMLGPARLYAGFAPLPERPPGDAEPAATGVARGVRLRFGARRLRARIRFRATPPPGRQVNVRRTPRSLAGRTVADTLGRGEVFVAFQRVDDGASPAGTTSGTWYGNRDGSEWVHRSGLRRVSAPARVFAGRDSAPEEVGLPDDVTDDDLGPGIADLARVTAASDPAPDAPETAFPGVPLTDAQLAQLPLEDADPVPPDP